MEGITLNKADFLKAMEVGGSLSGKSKALPITSCVRVKIHDGNVRIISSDTENFMSFTYADNNIQSESEDFCVNFKDFYNYVKLIKDESFQIVNHSLNLSIIHKKGKCKLPLMATEDFPVVNNVGDVLKFSLPSEKLGKWINEAKNFVADDDFRPALGTIFFYCKDGEVGCCSSDGHKLYFDIANMESIPDFQFNLNKSSFGAVSRICSGCDSVDIEITDNNIKFKNSSSCLLSRKIEYKYPNFKSVIPKNNNIIVDIDRKDMIDSITRCRLSAGISSILVLSSKGMMLEISCEDIDFGKKSSESIMVNSNGNITIGVNCDFLLTVLNSMDGDNVSLYFSEPSRPILAKEKEDVNKVLLIMPMMMSE